MVSNDLPVNGGRRAELWRLSSPEVANHFGGTADRDGRGNSRGRGLLSAPPRGRTTGSTRCWQGWWIGQEDTKPLGYGLAGWQLSRAAPSSPSPKNIITP
ncbi:MAG: hypothetical protein JRH18_18920 [Deltaproteobacteria bacterium]|nr:hypothetical protein [Deltaproteobacteria bacterium]MBW2153727.1 hypothetical protein [Deltaproteobacteria bacterium]